MVGTARRRYYGRGRQRRRRRQGRSKQRGGYGTAATTDTVPTTKNWTAWTASYVIVGVGSLADGQTVAMPDCINNKLSGQ